LTGLIWLQGAVKRYETAGPPALDGVDLTVTAGEAVAVMGPSGSGKSTLLNLIAGLDRPSAGRVEVAGTDLGRLSETALARFRRSHIGIVFQFFHLLDELTARENIAVPAQLLGTPRRTALARADELLDRLGLSAKAGAYPGRLSGGERQRVALARALVNEPPLLLADEPTGAVDANAGAQVADLFRDLNRGGQTILLVTHDPALARRCATRVVELRDGRLTAAEVPGPTTATPDHTTAAPGVPA
jgi:ABC-type antimicrobial peptide transport system, ATPase component